MENSDLLFEEEYQSIFENATEGIFQSTVTGRFLKVNPAMARIYGYDSPQDMLDSISNINEQIYIESSDRKHFIAEMKTSGSVRGFESRNYRKDSSIIWTLTNARAIFDATGEISYFEGFVIDITAKKKAEEALLASEARYRSLAEASNDMIYIIGKSGTIEYINSFAARQFNLDPSAIIGKTMQGMFPAEIAKRQAKHLRQVMKTGKPTYIEAETVFSDKAAWLGTWLVPLKNGGGKTESVMGVSRDITENKMAQSSLQESEQRLRSIIEHTRDVFYSHTPEHRLTFMSHQVHELLGYTPEEALRDWHEFLSDNPVNEKGVLLTQKAIDTGHQQQPYSLELIHKDGHPVWVEVRESPLVQDGQTIAVVGALIDITDRKISEERVNRQLDELTVLHQVALAATSSLSVDALIEQVTHIISETLYSDNCGVELISDSGDQLLPHRSYHGASGDLLRWQMSINEGVAGRVARTGITLRIGDVSQEPAYIEATDGVQSELCVPIKIQDRTIGVVNVESKKRDAFSESDERLLATVANTLAIGIQQLRLFETEQQRRWEAETMREITTALTTSLNSNALFASIFDSIAKIVPYDSASIALLDKDEMEIVAGRGFPKGFNVIGKRLPNEGKWKVLAEKRQPMIISDVHAEPEFVQWEGSEYIRGWMGIPLFTHDSLIGTIHLDSKQVNAFNSSSANLLQTFANSVAVAIENATLYEEAVKTSERQAVLYRISQEIVQLAQEPEKTYTAIHQATRELMPCDSFAIVLHDEERQENVGVYLYDQNKKYPVLRRPASLGLTAEIISKNETMVFHDLNNAQKDAFTHFGAKKRVRSVLAVPLRIGNNVIGMLSTQSYLPGVYGDEDRILFEMLSAQAASAIENIRLFASEQKSRQRAEILREATAALTTTIELKDLNKIILGAANKLVPYDSASIELLEGNDLVIVAEKGFPRKTSLLNTRYPFDTTNWGDLSTVRQPIIIPDVRNDPRFEIFEETDYIRGWMGIPLISQETLIGFLNFDSKQVNYFTEDHAAIAQTFGNQAAVAIDNALIYKEEQTLRQRSTILLELMRITASSLELAEVMNTILHRLIELVPSTSGTIQLHNSDGLRIAATAGFTKKILTPGTLLPINDYPLNASAIATKQPVYIPNTLEHPEYVFVSGLELIRSFLCVPLIYKNNAIGLITLDSHEESHFNEQDIDLIQAVARYAAISIENARLFEGEQQRRQESETLREAALAITTSLELEDVLETILVAMNKVVPFDSASVLFEQDGHLAQAATKGFSDQAYLTTLTFPSNDVLYQEIKRNQKTIIIRDAQEDERFNNWAEASEVHGWMGVPLIIRGEVIGCITVDNLRTDAYDDNLAGLAEAFSNQAATAIQNARQFQAEQHHYAEAETLRLAAESINSTLDIRQVLTSILDNLNRVVPFDSAGVFLIENDAVRLTALRGMPGGEASIDRSFPADNALLQAVLRIGKPLILKDAQKDSRYEKWVVGEKVRGWMGVPLIVRGVTIGFITMDSFKLDAYQDHDATLAMTFAHQAAAALENARLFERGEKQIRQLTVLRDIDSAISSSFDLKVTLNILLSHASRELNAYSAAILLYYPESYTLSFFTGIGKQENRHLVQTDLRLGKGLAGKVVLDRKMVHIQDLGNSEEKFRDFPLPSSKPMDYFGLPLIGKGQIKGVLEIYTKPNPAPDQDWLNFLQTLAGQAAIAIDNVQLFRNLQRTNQELSLAYDTTLEGWARALELRDKETEGHSHRVVDMTIGLARQLGFEGEDLTNLKRGTLLHDIGKMGIPDIILHKKGPLTDAEWVIMRQHPVYALELLQPINYLRQALDIPYGHHERWDGSGYPRGLKAEAIPMAARIFAVVDVWDALLHDRPYRKAWPTAKVLDYLQDQSGKEFDPRVIEAFLQILEDQT